MKSSKLLALAGVTLLAATTLAACSGSGSSTRPRYWAVTIFIFFAKMLFEK
ncbi:hypothetical protein [Streptococcus pneumoniae]|uniref:hypothetical protein n=1 Tax=Streptococcus pneumoniae TaxID=1313 RepID=UPI000B0B6E8B|nr:hypothetical protein [Streptococcus pneumoniae]